MGVSDGEEGGADGRDGWFIYTSRGRRQPAAGRSGTWLLVTSHLSPGARLLAARVCWHVGWIGVRHRVLNLGISRRRRARVALDIEH